MERSVKLRIEVSNKGNLVTVLNSKTPNGHIDDYDLKNIEDRLMKKREWLVSELDEVDETLKVARVMQSLCDHAYQNGLLEDN